MISTKSKKWLALLLGTVTIAMISTSYADKVPSSEIDKENIVIKEAIEALNEKNKEKWTNSITQLIMQAKGLDNQSIPLFFEFGTKIWEYLQKYDTVQLIDMTVREPLQNMLDENSLPIKKIMLKIP